MFFASCTYVLPGFSQAAEQLPRGSQLPSAAKAATDCAALTARLEAAPFQNAIEIRVFLDRLAMLSGTQATSLF
jgi:hypothetical protein